MKCKNCQKFEELLKKSIKQTNEAQELVNRYAKDLKEMQDKYLNVLRVLRK